MVCKSLSIIALIGTALFAAGPAVMLENTNYPIPSAALFVAPNGNDTNAGTQTAPLKTIRKAVGKATSGTTIVIREGVYREAIGTVNAKKITMQPFPHEQVWIKGSDIVTGWVQDGKVWRKDNWYLKLVPVSDTNTIDKAYPMAKYPDQAFLDGKPLAQVGTLDKVAAGTFFVDTIGAKLYIGDDPAGHTVEASVRTICLNLQFGTDSSIVRGLGFVHFASTFGAREGNSAVVGNVAALVFENNTFAYNSNRGLAIYGQTCIIRGNSFLYNGEGGFGGYKAHGTLLEDNYVGYNNTEHFKLGWDANGIKFAATHNLIWKNNVAEHNIGGGLWCDNDCDNNIFVGNVVRYNTKWNGILIELPTSSGGIVASNLIYGNEGTGISMGGAGNVKIYNNTFANNGTNISIGRCATGHIVKNNILSNITNTLYNGTCGLYYVECPSLPGDSLVRESDYNAFYRTSSTAPAQRLIFWGKDSAFLNLTSFQQKTGNDLHSISIDNEPVNPFFKDEANGDFSLKAGSIVKGKGEPLPQDVADAIGVTAGVSVDMGALLWAQTSAIENRTLRTGAGSGVFAPEIVRSGMDLFIHLQSPGAFKLQVFDIAGRQVMSHAGQRANSGTYKISWAKNGIGNGLYMVRLTAGNRQCERLLPFLK